MTALRVIAIKRAYLAPAPEDGLRVLVDRLWPRGLARRDAALHHWMKDLGPSHELRQWFAHRPERWESFRERYDAELSTPRAQGQLADLLLTAADFTRLTLLYAARDTERNQAIVLADRLRSMLRQ